MPVIIPLFAPGGAGRVLATIYAPLDGWPLAEHVGFHERADVQAHAVVQVGMPADGWRIAAILPHPHRGSGRFPEASRFSLKNDFNSRPIWENGFSHARQKGRVKSVVLILGNWNSYNPYKITGALQDTPRHARE
jgi:hypothetical protein